MSTNNTQWFTKRPRRTRRCTQCKGCGIVEMPYALAPTSLHVDGAPCDAILAGVVGSFDIFTACDEASSIARDAGRPVAFEFNGRCVVVRPKDDSQKVARRWWKAKYNETPEQTAARR